MRGAMKPVSSQERVKWFPRSIFGVRPRAVVAAAPGCMRVSCSVRQPEAQWQPMIAATLIASSINAETILR